MMFGGLARETLDTLEAGTRWFRARRDQVILPHGERVSEILAPVDVGLRVQMVSPNGKLVSLRRIEPLQLMCVSAALADGPALGSVVAISPCLVAAIPVEVFRTAIADDRTLSDRVSAHLAVLVEEMTSRVFELALLDVRARVLSELLRLSQRGASIDGGMLIDPAPTHEEIASQIGTNREAVTRTLSWLEGEKVIERQLRRIFVRSQAALEALVERSAGLALVPARADSG